MSTAKKYSHRYQRSGWRYRVNAGKDATVVRRAYAADLVSRLCCIIAALVVSSAASAQNFLGARYDAVTDELVVQIAYRGTHSGHEFSLRWEECKSVSGSDGPYEVAALVVDSHWNDRALEDFQQTVRFTLEGLTCRPARVTLHSAARFAVTLDVPAVTP